MIKEKGLVGKFSANIGDLIFMSNEDDSDEAGGFVKSIHDDTIELSHENPYKRKNWWMGSGRISFTKGIRMYSLRRYEKLEIVKPYHPQETQR